MKIPKIEIQFGDKVKKNNKKDKKEISKYQKVLSWIDIIYGIGYGATAILGLIIILFLISLNLPLQKLEVQLSVGGNIFTIFVAALFISSGIYTIEKYKNKFSEFYKYNTWFLLIYGSLNLIELILLMIIGNINNVLYNNVPYLIFISAINIVSSVSITINGFYLRKK
jgi:hypothetical protein